MRNWLRGRIRLGRLTVSWGLGSAGAGPTVLVIASPRVQSVPIEDTRFTSTPLTDLVLQSEPIEDTRFTSTIAT